MPIEVLIVVYFWACHLFSGVIKVLKFLRHAWVTRYRLVRKHK